MEVREPHASIGCQDLLSVTAYTYSGWLRKRSQFHATFSHLCKFIPWFHRYAVLTSGCMYLYKSESSKTPCCAFSLCGFKQAIRAGDILQNDTPWPFKLQTMDQCPASYYFAASSEYEMQKWMNHLNNDIYESNKILDDKRGNELRTSLHEKDIEDDENCDYWQITKVGDMLVQKPPYGHSQGSPSPQCGHTAQPVFHRPPVEPPRPPIPIRRPAPPAIRRQAPDGMERQAQHTETQCAYGDNLPPQRRPPDIQNRTSMANISRNPSSASAQPAFDQQMYINLMGPNPDIAFWGAMLCHTNAIAAGREIQEIGINGVFLIRLSEQEGQPVLVYFADGITKKIKIKVNNYGAYFVDPGHDFKTIQALIEFYQKSPMPSMTPSDVRLTTPYKRAPRRH